MAHIDKFGLIDILQSAYRLGHGVETALAKIKNDIDRAIDDGKGAIMVLLDGSAAFDLVNIDILLKRLKIGFGVSDHVISWFSSYLRHRRQQVMINSSISDEIELNIGVQQRSILGPLLYLIYITPLSRLIRNHDVMNHGYADDVQLYKFFLRNCQTSLYNAISKVNGCIDDVSKWMVQNRLKLNGDKTEFMLIGTQPFIRNLRDFPHLIVNGSRVYNKPVVRNLGAKFDNILSMSAQINDVVRICTYLMRGIRRVKHFVDYRVLNTLVVTNVLSRIDFVNCLFTGLSSYSLHKLDVVINNAARLIVNVPVRNHITPTLINLHWLKPKFRIEYRCIVMIYKCIHNYNMPSYIKDMFQVYKPVRVTRLTVNGHYIMCPRFRTTFGERCFQITAINLWNSLPNEMQEIERLNVFKRKLKTYLFQKCYN